MINLKPRVNPPRWLRLASWIAVAAWALGIFILSSMSGTEISEINVLDIWDKAAHFSAFAVGAVLLALALRWNTAWSWLRVTLTAIVAISIFGATDEWHQLYTPHRSGADVGDWTADTLGAIAGATLIHARHRFTNRPAPRGA